MRMRYTEIFLFKTPVVEARWFSYCLGFLVLGGVGWTHSSKVDRVGSLKPALTPDPPAFLKGPCALLLTNKDGFATHVVLERGTASGSASGLSGDLMVRGDKL